MVTLCRTSLVPELRGVQGDAAFRILELKVMDPLDLYHYGYLAGILLRQSAGGVL
jgi:hypothetical protein